METEFSNIEIKAGGLNHFSILLEAKYKDTGKDGYPMIKEKFYNYYSKLINEIVKNKENEILRIENFFGRSYR